MLYIFRGLCKRRARVKCDVSAWRLIVGVMKYQRLFVKTCDLCSQLSDPQSFSWVFSFWLMCFVSLEWKVILIKSTLKSSATSSGPEVRCDFKSGTRSGVSTDASVKLRLVNRPLMGNLPSSPPHQDRSTDKFLPTACLLSDTHVCITLTQTHTHTRMNLYVIEPDDHWLQPRADWLPFLYYHSGIPWRLTVFWCVCVCVCVCVCGGLCGRGLHLHLCIFFSSAWKTFVQTYFPLHVFALVASVRRNRVCLCLCSPFLA